MSKVPSTTAVAGLQLRRLVADQKRAGGVFGNPNPCRLGLSLSQLVPDFPKPKRPCDEAYRHSTQDPGA
jgi:hypothetical protein